MPRSRSTDPISRLSRSDRRAWRAAERRLRADHEVDQMVALLGLAAAGGGVTGVTTPTEVGDSDPAGPGVTPVELVIQGRRVRAARVHRRTLVKLRDALASIATVPLTAVTRYGPYWVLTFRLATEQLVVLADQLTLLPEWGEPGGRQPGRGPLGPRAGLAI